MLMQFFYAYTQIPYKCGERQKDGREQKSVPRSSESHVDVSVPVTFVAKVDADSVDVLMVVSAVDAIDDPITITFAVIVQHTKFCNNNQKKERKKKKQYKNKVCTHGWPFAI